MRTRRILATGLGLAVAGVMTASAALPATSSADSRTQTLRFIGTDVTGTDLDLGEPGDSLGDQFIGTSDLTRNGWPAGEAHIVCQAVRILETGVTAQCAGTLVLPAGQITVHGAPTFTDDLRFTLAITGGTGRYKTAQGEIHSRSLSQTRDELLVWLTR